MHLKKNRHWVYLEIETEKRIIKRMQNRRVEKGFRVI